LKGSSTKNVEKGISQGALHNDFEEDACNTNIAKGQLKM